MIRRQSWFPRWANHQVVLVAPGPTAKRADLEKIRTVARVVAINNAIKLCPWAEVAFGGDRQWWVANDGLPNFRGLKVMSQQFTQPLPAEWNVHNLSLPRQGGSGAHALKWVASLEPRSITLVGFDLTLSHGVHFDGPHDRTKGLTDPTAGDILRFRRAVEGLIIEIVDSGIEVYTTSPICKPLIGATRASLDDAVNVRPRLELVGSKRVARVPKTKQA